MATSSLMFSMTCSDGLDLPLGAGAAGFDFVVGEGALVQVRSCGTLVILITSFGEFLLYFIVTFDFIFI